MKQQLQINFNKWFVVAGPCAAESKIHIIKTAEYLVKNNISIMRAGIWKPRTNPKDWQGPGDKGLTWLIAAKNATGISVATEVKDSRTLIKATKANIDIFWVGSRNGQNYALLNKIGKETAKTNVPVILKRSMSSSLDEWIGAAGYITKHNKNVILCERGIRAYSPDTRNTLDLQTAYLAKAKSGLPVIVDVSHAAGRRDLIIPMSKAVKAAGFNGLMIEVHPSPDKAKTDGHQQISFNKFDKLISDLNKIN
ncbi:3-deoxy-7-phosphoheptulonate synthase [Patescibacteria group bacterium]